jgi:hypothetical protein
MNPPLLIVLAAGLLLSMGEVPVSTAAVNWIMDFERESLPGG